MDMRLKIALLWILIMSIVGFIAMGIDKSKAKRNAWRIPEKTLLMIAFLGGGAGVWLGMEVFRHKTKHSQFKLGKQLSKQPQQLVSIGTLRVHDGVILHALKGAG